MGCSNSKDSSSVKDSSKRDVDTRPIRIVDTCSKIAVDYFYPLSKGRIGTNKIEVEYEGEKPYKSTLYDDF